jgi:hypothetical protein
VARLDATWSAIRREGSFQWVNADPELSAFVSTTHVNASGLVNPPVRTPSPTPSPPPQVGCSAKDRRKGAAALTLAKGMDICNPQTAGTRCNAVRDAGEGGTHAHLFLERTSERRTTVERTSERRTTVERPRRANKRSKGRARTPPSKHMNTCSCLCFHSTHNHHSPLACRYICITSVATQTRAALLRWQRRVAHGFSTATAPTAPGTGVAISKSMASLTQ